MGWREGAEPGGWSWVLAWGLLMPGASVAVLEAIDIAGKTYVQFACADVHLICIFPSL